MSYQPPDLATAFAAVGTNATPFTATAHTLVAAPGASKRHRIWAVHLSMEVGPAAGGLARVDINAPLSVGTFDFMRVQTAVDDPPPHYYPGGKAMVANEALMGTSYASVAGLPLKISVYYTTEAIAV